MAALAHVNANKVRIIGGIWRSRQIHFTPLPGLRPTPDRVRETLFNWLAPLLADKRCLDLYAGSGALGFEALSRGASQVVMVESNRVAARALADNAARLGAEHLEIVARDALEYLVAVQNKFDIVFLDPPFRQGQLERALQALPPALSDEALVYVESEAGAAPAPDWQVFKQGKAGKVSFRLLKRGE